MHCDVLAKIGKYYTTSNVDTTLQSNNFLNESSNSLFLMISKWLWSIIISLISFPFTKIEMTGRVHELFRRLWLMINFMNWFLVGQTVQRFYCADYPFKSDSDKQAIAQFCTSTSQACQVVQTTSIAGVPSYEIACVCQPGYTFPDCSFRKDYHPNNRQIATAI